MDNETDLYFEKKKKKRRGKVKAHKNILRATGATCEQICSLNGNGIALFLDCENRWKIDVFFFWNKEPLKKLMIHEEQLNYHIHITQPKIIEFKQFYNVIILKKTLKINSISSLLMRLTQILYNHFIQYWTSNIQNSYKPLTYKFNSS